MSQRGLLCASLGVNVVLVGVLCIQYFNTDESVAQVGNSEARPQVALTQVETIVADRIAVQSPPQESGESSPPSDSESTASDSSTASPRDRSRIEPTLIASMSRRLALGVTADEQLDAELLNKIDETLGSTRKELDNARAQLRSRKDDALKDKIARGDFERLAPGEEVRSGLNGGQTYLRYLEDGTPIRVTIRPGEAALLDVAQNEYEGLVARRIDDVQAVLETWNKGH